MRIVKQLPNILTLCNLFCGCLAVLFAMHGHFPAAALFMFAGIFFDFFDGLAARVLDAKSALGLQLDSLADLVTSGLVPGIVMYKLLTAVFPSTGIFTGQLWERSGAWSEDVVLAVPLLGFLITLASAYRLAKFNVDEEQQTYFKGLPTPANAILIVSLPLLAEFQPHAFIQELLLSKWFLPGITLISAYLMVSSIKLFALKFSGWGIRDNALRYVFLGLCAVLLAVFKFAAVPLLILSYILLSVFFFSPDSQDYSQS